MFARTILVPMEGGVCQILGLAWKNRAMPISVWTPTVSTLKRCLVLWYCCVSLKPRCSIFAEACLTRTSKHLSKLFTPLTHSLISILFAPKELPTPTRVLQTVKAWPCSTMVRVLWVSATPCSETPWFRTLLSLALQRRWLSKMVSYWPSYFKLYVTYITICGLSVLSRKCNRRFKYPNDAWYFWFIYF